MPLYTPTQFSNICGIALNTLKEDIGKNKIVLASDGKRINSTNPTNEKYLKHFENKKIKSEVEKRLSVGGEKKPVVSMDLDQQKKIKDIELKEVQIRLKKFEEKRLEGELIPRDLVANAFEVFSQSFIDCYKDESDTFKIKFSSSNKLKSKAAADLHNGLIELNNSAHKKSLEMAFSELKKAFEHAKQRK